MIVQRERLTGVWADVADNQGEPTLVYTTELGAGKLALRTPLMTRPVVDLPLGMRFLKAMFTKRILVAAGQSTVGDILQLVIGDKLQVTNQIAAYGQNPIAMARTANSGIAIYIAQNNRSYGILTLDADANITGWSGGHPYPMPEGSSQGFLGVGTDGEPIYTDLARVKQTKWGPLTKPDTDGLLVVGQHTDNDNLGVLVQEGNLPEKFFTALQGKLDEPSVVRTIRGQYAVCGRLLNNFCAWAILEPPFESDVPTPPDPPPHKPEEPVNHQGVVEQVKRDVEAAGIQVSGSVTGCFEVTKRVAWALRDEVGLLVKPGGENIVEWRGQSYSAGRVCYPDGRPVKILSDVPATANPQWSVDDVPVQAPQKYSPALEPEPLNGNPPPPPPPPPGDDILVEIRSLVLELRRRGIDLDDKVNFLTSVVGASFSKIDAMEDRIEEALSRIAALHSATMQTLADIRRRQDRALRGRAALNISLAPTEP